MISATEQLREKRRKIFNSVFAAVSIALTVFLVYGLRILILPCIIGCLAAFICTPILTTMKRKKIPKGLAILILFGGLFIIMFGLSRLVGSMIPDEKGKLEMKVTVKNKINFRYKQYMGLDKRIDNADEKGNLLYSLIGKEVDPLLEKFNAELNLNESEEEKFIYYRKYAYRTGTLPISDKVWKYYIENQENKKQHNAENDMKNIDSISKTLGGLEKSPDARLAEKEKGEESSFISAFTDVFSIWIVFPFVFLFLLLDDGNIKKIFIRAVPNRYFEVALTVVDEVTVALGKYLRGTATECSLVGLTFVVCLSFIGVSFKWAIFIGIFAGVANAIPFLGPAIGCIAGLIYALLAEPENVNAILPFCTADNMIFGVLVTVGIAQGMDNAVFQPIVLGSAVELHPLVVVIGVMGGSILFGFAGMLFAIPAIVIVKVVAFTLLKKLKDYRII